MYHQRVSDPLVLVPGDEVSDPAGTTWKVVALLTAGGERYLMMTGPHELTSLMPATTVTGWTRHWE
jgi:hypothetical protein